MNDAHDRSESGSTGLFFPSTCWGQIRPEAASSADSAALETLGRRYWRPIHAYLRMAFSRGDEEARDLAQDFFVWMIETDFLRKADPSRGRFRAFLKTALRHYVADEDRKRLALKRGGGRRFVPLEGDGEDSQAPGLPAAPAASPDESLDEAWRAEVLRLAIQRVEEDLRRSGREIVFAVFRDYFLDPTDDIDYQQVAARHGITKVDVSNHLARAKRLYRDQLRALVMDTVHSATDLDDELRWLLLRDRR